MAGVPLEPRTRVEVTITPRCTMKMHVLKGSKQEIAASLARINGEVREAIVFEEEPAAAAPMSGILDTEDIFAEMCPFMVDVQDVDDSREAIYTRMEGE